MREKDAKGGGGLVLGVTSWRQWDPLLFPSLDKAAGVGGRFLVP